MNNILSTLAGTCTIMGTVFDSPKGTKMFSPMGVAVNSSDGTVFVADTGNHVSRIQLC